MDQSIVSIAKLSMVNQVVTLSQTEQITQRFYRIKIKGLRAQVLASTDTNINVLSVKETQKKKNKILQSTIKRKEEGAVNNEHQLKEEIE